MRYWHGEIGSERAMTRPDIDAMAAMVAKATEGPWRSQHNIDFPYEPGYLVYRAPSDGGPFGSGGDIGWQASEADADFIAAAREYIPAIHAYVRGIEALSDRQAARIRKAEAEVVEHERLFGLRPLDPDNDRP